MRKENSGLVVNERHFRIDKVIDGNTSEGWAFYEVTDRHTNFEFCVAEYFGENVELEKAQSRAEKLIRLKIKGLPHIYDMLVEKQSLFIVMDTVKGGALREYLTARRGPAREDLVAMVEYARRLCALLAQLHPALVHRKLQPENIIIVKDRILLADLGFLLMPLGYEKEMSPYRAPEQIRDGEGEDVGCWTDIYAFGIILGEMLTGACPGMGGQGFCPASGPGEYRIKSMDLWQNIPHELKEVVVHCTQPLPKHRPIKIEEVKRKLSQWLLFEKGELLRGAPVAIAGGALLADQIKITETGHDARRVKGVAKKMVLLLPAVCCVFILLFLLQNLLSERPTNFEQTVKSAHPAEITALTNPGGQRRESLNNLARKFEDFASLLTAYQHAMVQSSPEKTARNFRDVQRKAEAHLYNFSGLSITEKELQDVAALEIEMFEALKSSAEIFADYIEGKRKITGSVDWVDEANIRYRRALELNGQAARELEKLKMNGAFIM